jgi:very-short-patch-repair endonuclease
MPRDPVLVDRARILRRNMGEAEKKLWFRLRRRKLAGYRFRRQVPIGGYIVDFACVSARLIIEVDGGRHSRREGHVLDEMRTELLEARGYQVLRFWNSDVLSDIDRVTRNIYSALAGRTTPHPALRATLPHGGGEISRQD